ncbi:hypothetical protein CYMTET_32145 [Cymbomonas tetramitiformis]|uniref:Uncharacterized protein n=1 Tax=Cymbomonas tetramitiformis TaxID=36881 RepID=A0AAE0FG83_9CHLO|nr:hypothetical protein CYMTET_32145 [Cymbomonas tetramitiformis]
MSVTCEILRRRTPTGSDNNLTDALKVIFEKATRTLAGPQVAASTEETNPAQSSTFIKIQVVRAKEVNTVDSTFFVSKLEHRRLGHRYPEDCYTVSLRRKTKKETQAGGPIEDTRENEKVDLSAPIATGMCREEFEHIIVFSASFPYVSSFIWTVPRQQISWHTPFRLQPRYHYNDVPTDLTEGSSGFIASLDALARTSTSRCVLCSRISG